MSIQPKVDKAPGLTRIPGDGFNGYFNEWVSFCKAFSWLHSVWTSWHHRPRQTWEPALHTLNMRWLLNIVPLSWPCPNEGWQPCADQSLLSWDSSARSHTRREAAKCSLPSLIFRFEKSSTLQGRYCKRFPFVFCGNCFSPPLSAKIQGCAVLKTLSYFMLQSWACWMFTVTVPHLVTRTWRQFNMSASRLNKCQVPIVSSHIM